MSRIGKKPIALPAGVKFAVADKVVTVEGPKGKLSLELPPHVTAAVEGNDIVVSPVNETRQANAMHGLARSLINNMVAGVTAGFKKELVVIGVGYKATLAGSKLTLNLGFSHTIEFEVPKEIKLTIAPGDSMKQLHSQAQNVLIIEGIDKQLVGETAAQIRRFRPPEPYKGKGIRYVDERIILKEGKSAG